MFLLDTDTLTLFFYGAAQVVAKVAEVPKAEIGTTIITKIEILRGRLDHVLKAEGQEKCLAAQFLLLNTERDLEKIQQVLLDDVALQHFERLRQTKGTRKIGRADLLIASIVLAKDATLVTKNQKDFKKVPQLKIVDWTK